MRISSMLSPLLFCVAACGPNVSTQRLATFPPNPAKCEVKIEKLSPAEVEGLDTIYAVAGIVAVSDFETKNPYDERVLELIRPEVCKLGADALSVARRKTGADGATTAYYALRHK